MNPDGKNLVAGNLSRGILSLAGPMLASAVLQHVQSLIDLFWVGRLGSESVAGVALAGVVMMAVFPVIMGISTGTLALVSRAVGAGRIEDASATVRQSLLLAGIMGILAGIAGFIWAGDLCALLVGSATAASSNAHELAAQYLRISFLGSITVFLLFTASSVFQAAGRVAVPMAAMAISNIVNMILDPILIYGLAGFPKLGVNGAALATVLAQAAGAAMVVMLLCRGRAGFHAQMLPIRVDVALMWRIGRIGLPSTGQLLSRNLMAMALMSLVGRCGTAALAGYGIGTRFHMMALMPAFAFGNAVAPIVGQNLGAGKPERAAAAAWIGLGSATAVMAVIATCLFLFAAPLVRIFDASPAVVAVGGDYLRIVSPFYVFSMAGIVLGRALQGAGDTIPPMILTLVSLWGLQVPLAVALSRAIEPATRGIWWAIGIAVTAHGCLTAAWFMRGKWKHKRI